MPDYPIKWASGGFFYSLNEGVEKPESGHPIQTGQLFFERCEGLADIFTIANFQPPHTGLKAA